MNGPMTSPINSPMKRKIAAILAADVAGYSRLVAEDEEETLARLGAFREVFDALVRAAGGRIFNTAGDSVMCEFDSAVEAVRCAIEIQESLRARNLPYPPGRRLEFRIGITIGDVVERAGDLLGDGVNIAARLESLAEPGGICVSRSVHEAVSNKVPVPFRDIGERRVKNLPSPVHAFVADWPGADAARSETAPPAQAATEHRRVPWLAGSALVAVLAIGAAAATLYRPSLRPMPHHAQRPGVAVPAPAPKEAAATAAPLDPAETFAALARQDGIVADAKTAPEIYHNARLYEARGEPAQARHAYHALTLLDSEHIDPHLRYAALIRARDGDAGARTVYAELMRENRARVVELVHALQFEGAERRAKVEAFAEAHPDYAPAHYLVAEEYSEDRIGAQTLTERRLEFAALERFLEADAEGRLAPFFLDRSLLAQWLDRARARKSATESFFRTGETKPTASFSRTAAGWLAAFSLPEPATAIEVRLGETGPFRSTGLSSAVDPRTGRAAPHTELELPEGQQRTTLYVQYEDASGRTAGPFPIVFDPDADPAAAPRQGR